MIRFKNNFSGKNRQIDGLKNTVLYLFYFLMGSALFLNQCQAQSVIDRASPMLGWVSLDSAHYLYWKGVRVVGNDGFISLPKGAGFKYPVSEKSDYAIGFLNFDESTRDWRAFYGIAADIYVPQKKEISFRITLTTPKAKLRQTILRAFHADFLLSEGWHHVVLPWTVFSISDRQIGALKYINGLKIDGALLDQNGTGLNNEVVGIRLRNVRLVKAEQVALNTPVNGKSVNDGQTADYNVQVINCSDSIQTIKLQQQEQPFSVMKVNIVPATFTLRPGTSAVAKVSVEVPKGILPPGGHEIQCIQAICNGRAANTLQLITARQYPHPYIIHTEEGWADVRKKVEEQDWAKKELARYIRSADNWTAPILKPVSLRFNKAENHSYVYTDQDYIQMQQVAFTYQITHNKVYAQKVADMLRQFYDKDQGYPKVLSATNNGGPQEGEDWQRIAIAYDAIYDAGVLTQTDKDSIEYCMRLYMQIFEEYLTVGNMGNWSTSQSTAALFCALAMGDLSAVNRYIYGSCGFTDFLSKGVMDDGWWWEGSTGYNLWVARELTQEALACKPWGIDLLNLQVPTNYSPYAILAPWAMNPPYGVSFEKWGPIRKNTRSIKQLWDAVAKAADYRGIVFGMNDGHNELVSGINMEVAYYAFKDPAYADILKLASERDLVYGVPTLPEQTQATYSQSSCAENIGFALLRSQKENRPEKDQIQAVLKIGTQGGFHGHFDRVSLDNLSRYGRTFWNPETIWWGYANFMYKFYVQTSVNHNMVVVDQKQQEAVPSKQLLFFSGKMMQVSEQQTIAKWSDPPYLGMQYNSNETLLDQMKKNKQSIPIVKDRAYGAMGPNTEPVLQRRLAIVTDDYVILADYLKGDSVHTFDNLFQMRKLLSLSCNNNDLKVDHHDAQYNPDPRRAAQFITDVNWYKAKGNVLARFQFDYGAGADNSGTNQQFDEPGKLKIDVHSIWPQNQSVMIAQPPETFGGQQWVDYEVKGDGKSLDKGESGIWILGNRTIDVSVKNLDEIALSVQSSGSQRKSLFLSNVRLVLADGREITASQLPGDKISWENTEKPEKAGLDYYGGPIKIAGNKDSSALAIQPSDESKPAILHISLKGLKAVRFKATLGGDYPFGPETDRRRVYGSRVIGKEANFLTVLEPYDNQSEITHISATDASDFEVTLSDGRVQEIHIHALEDKNSKASVDIIERKDGKIIRQEHTAQ